MSRGGSCAPTRYLSGRLSAAACPGVKDAARGKKTVRHLKQADARRDEQKRKKMKRRTGGVRKRRKKDDK
jgi:hypothetical protein